MIECEQPHSKQRRGKGKSDPIDAHLAVLAALRLGKTRLPAPRADGDRALNRAIHAIALTRMRSCPRTRAYVARRTAEGKTTREIRRCLKRYIAHELYRQLNRSMNLPTAP